MKIATTPSTRRVCGLLAALVLACWPGAAVAQEPAPPSLKLVSAGDSVRAHPREVTCCLDLGLWLTPSGGDFRVDLRRPGYGRWEAAQVDAATGAVLRPIPSELVAGLRGFRELVRVRIVDGRGRTVGRRAVTVCPGGFDVVERFSDLGPPLPGFDGACSHGFPFTSGMVWGLSNGWAIPILIEGNEYATIPRHVLAELPRRVRERIRRLQRRGPAPIRLEPGSYRVVAELGEAYQRLFAIPPEDARVTLRMRVTQRRRRGRGADARPARAARPLRPRPLPAQVTGQPAPETLPDLAALPPWSLRTRHSERSGRDVLTFASSPWNAGPAPLVVEGFRRPGGAVMDAYQYFFDADGDPAGRAPAGEMVFHDAPRHNHWHFLQFVSYRLLRPDGRTAVRSRKQSFCITSTDPVDLTLPRALVGPELATISRSSCGSPNSLWLRQALPTGWADTYSAGIPGQSFDITRVPNGRYLVEMHVNPLGELAEVSADNNVERRRVTLSGEPGRRRVQAAPWQGIRR